MRRHHPLIVASAAGLVLSLTGLAPAASASPASAPTAGVSVAGPLAAAPDAGAVNDFVGRINALRASVGVAPLTFDGGLAGSCLSWADHMAATRTLQHDGGLVNSLPPGGARIGENVGFGPAVDPIWRAFVASPGHYDNLVDPGYTHVGVAVVSDGGTLWTVHRFMSFGSAPAPTPAPAPQPLPVAPAPVVTAPPAPAASAPPATSAPTTAPRPSTTTTTAPPPPKPQNMRAASTEEPARAGAVLDALRVLTG